MREQSKDENYDWKGELENRFTYHPPQGDQSGRYEIIRNRAKMLAEEFTELCPQSRELSLAITNLEQAVFWANAAVARRS